MRFFTKRYDDVSTLDDNDLICYCIGVDKKSIIQAIRDGADTLSKVKEMTKACTGSDCKRLNPNKRCCSKEINALIELYKDRANV